MPLFTIILQASELIALLEEGVRTQYVPPHLTVVSSLLGLLLLSSDVKLCNKKKQLQILVIIFDNTFI